MTKIEVKCKQDIFFSKTKFIVQDCIYGCTSVINKAILYFYLSYSVDLRECSADCKSNLFIIFLVLQIC